MQTAFSKAQLRVPKIADAKNILTDCVHFGFCTAVCPTYVLLRDELDAPRGRIDLIHEMLVSDDAPSAGTVGYIDRCLSCNSCMSTCAAKVDYMHLVDIARSYIEANYRRPLVDRLFRWMLARTIPDALRFRRGVRMAQLARPFASLMTARLRALVSLAPRSLPPTSDAIAPGTYKANGTPRMRVLFLTGCVQQALAPRLNLVTVRLLNRHGCDVRVASGAECCGAFTLHLGKEEKAKETAKKTIAAWEDELGRAEVSGAPIDAVVMNASGCGTTVKDYGRIFAHEPEMADCAQRIANLAMDVTELLADIGLNAPASIVPLVIAYHDACSLQHAQKVIRPPRDLLRAAGFIVRDVPEGHFCCGSAGAYNMLQPVIARDLGIRKAAHIEGTGAAAIAAGNLGCITQLGHYTDLPTLHTVELLDWATGGPVPDGLAGVDLPDLVALAEESPENDPGTSAAGIW
ncbi:MAG: glycolate oxidase subunit GlcF [Pseudomonadota bacterium]|nr:glycolate oxidase subunit GlcF [Pseudomonadota bacterium]